MGGSRHTREEIRAAATQPVTTHNPASAKLRSLRAGGAPRSAPARVELPVLPACANGGGDEDIIERCPTCNGGGRHVRECEIHGRCTHDPVNPAVMDCRRCRRENLGFAPAPRPADAAAKSPRTVAVPPVGPLALPAPASTRAVVTVVTGAGAVAMHRISRPYHEAYAARLGADYVVLTEPPPVPEWPISAKFRLGRALDRYERVCFLDADALPLAGCPDLFALVEPGEFGFHDDLPGLTRNGGAKTLVDQYHETRRAGGLHPARCEYIANTGVLVYDRSHRAVFDPPTVPIPPRHCGEQSWYTVRMHDLAPRLRKLPPAANYQWWEWDGFRTLPAGAGVVAHFSGIVPGKSNDYRVARMREFVARFPAPPAPAPWHPPAALFPAPHPGYADARHLRWLRDVLLSGRFRRVLEIGCLHGFSTSALLDAAAAGAVDELHLCDPYPTPELERAVAASGAGGRVTFHPCRSIDLLTRDAAFDLVSVDGDHTAANVAEEARLLVAAGVPAVFAHDSAAAGLVPDCEGVPLLRDALARAGYALAEDARARPGERTERGMLFGARFRADFDLAAGAMRRWCG